MKHIRRRIAVITILSMLVGICPMGVAPSKASTHGLSNPTVNGSGVATWDTIYFGNYWQNDTNDDYYADKSDSKEPIQWRVLSVDGDDAFLMAEKNLDCYSYHSEDAETTWETSDIRSWLNNGFLNNAFTAEEQEAILTTTVTTSENEGAMVVSGSAASGNDTQDKVYLLSLDEVQNTSYGFGNDNARIAINTGYTADGGEIDGTMYSVNHADAWWLRTMGETGFTATCVSEGGYIEKLGTNCSSDVVGVRPVLHLDLSTTSEWSVAGTVSSDGIGQTPEASEMPLPTTLPAASEAPALAEFNPKLDLTNMTGFSISGTYGTVTTNADGTVSFSSQPSAENTTGSVFNNGVAWYLDKNKVDVSDYPYVGITVKEDVDFKLMTWSGGYDSESFWDKYDTWNFEKVVYHEDGSKTFYYATDAVFVNSAKAKAIGFTLKSAAHNDVSDCDEPDGEQCSHFEAQMATVYGIEFYKWYPVDIPLDQLTTDFDSESKIEVTEDENGETCTKIKFTKNNQRAWFDLPDEITLTNYDAIRITANVPNQLSCQVWDPAFDITADKWWNTALGGNYPFWSGSYVDRAEDGNSGEVAGKETQDIDISAIASITGKGGYLSIGSNGVPGDGEEADWAAANYYIYSVQLLPKIGVEPEVTPIPMPTVKPQVTASPTVTAKPTQKPKPEPTKSPVIEIGGPNVVGGEATTWDSIYFGSYWQNDTNGDGVANKEDEKEPIKWRVLSVDEDGEALLLADRNLDAGMFHNIYDDVTWENSDIRSWLNGSFASYAFTDTELAQISESQIINEANTTYNTSSGNDTTDKVFLLSEKEVNDSSLGFVENADRIALNTQYVSDGGEIGAEEMYAASSPEIWWLRTSGINNESVMTIGTTGNVDSFGWDVYEEVAVRPAIRLNLNTNTEWTYAGTSGGKLYACRIYYMGMDEEEDAPILTTYHVEGEIVNKSAAREISWHDDKYEFYFWSTDDVVVDEEDRDIQFEMPPYDATLYLYYEKMGGGIAEPTPTPGGSTPQVTSAPSGGGTGSTDTTGSGTTTGTNTTTTSKKDSSARDEVLRQLNELYAKEQQKQTALKNFTVKGIQYRVLKNTAKTRTVMVVKAKSKNIKSVTIPKTVKNGGKTFKVTEIGKNAFKGCKKLKTVTIGLEVTKIGNGAFKGCKKIKTIRILSKKLKKIGSKAFATGGSKKANVIVSREKIAKYRKLFKKAF